MPALRRSDPRGVAADCWAPSTVVLAALPSCGVRGTTGSGERRHRGQGGHGPGLDRRARPRRPRLPHGLSTGAPRRPRTVRGRTARRRQVGQRAVRGRPPPAQATHATDVGWKVSRPRNGQRARRDRAEGRAGTARARRDPERQAELLVAQVLDLLAQRDALVGELDLRIGRLLAEIRAMGWPPARQAAAACGLTVREAARLRDLVQPSVATPILDSSTTASDARRRQRMGEE